MNTLIRNTPSAENNERPRLLLLCSGRDLDSFRKLASEASVLCEFYDIRIEVSGLSRKNTAILTDPEDPYLEYKANTANLFNFSAPEEMSRFVEQSFVQENIALMERKICILREYGLRAAFCGNEPMCMPEAVYQEHPHWRGPRVDHPWRSRRPYFAMCFHQPEVRALYRRAVCKLTARFPEIDSFWFRINDSGSGLSWHPHLYFGANGPESSRGQSLEKTHYAFQEAILGGARDAGAENPICVASLTWDEADYGTMPKGAYRRSRVRNGEGGVWTIGADVDNTYPVRYIWNPLHLLEKLETARRIKPAVVVCWMSDVYYRTDTDSQTLGCHFSLWSQALKSPHHLDSHLGRMRLLDSFAQQEYGKAAADRVVDAWMLTHEVHHLQRLNLDDFLTRYLFYYGCVSNRWLTRPLVAFPGELAPEEERHYIRHVFSAFGDESRRNRLLNFHGSPVAELNGSYTQRSGYLGRLASLCATAGERFKTAADAATDNQREDLLRRAKALQIASCLWKTCRNVIEFGLLRVKGAEGDPEVKNSSIWSFPEFGDPAREYRKCVYEVLRRELDNTDDLCSLFGEDPERMIWRSNEAKEEDTFTLGPDLREQLDLKRKTIIRYWQDVMRLQPATMPRTWQQ